jgi:hypothetical protein
VVCAQKYYRKSLIWTEKKPSSSSKMIFDPDLESSFHAESSGMLRKFFHFIVHDK